MQKPAKFSNRFRQLRAFGLLWAPLLLPLPATASPDPTPPGVVVEEVVGTSALGKAGMQPGDVVLAWERPGGPEPSPLASTGETHGEIASPFDWEWMRTEHPPRGTLKLLGERQGEPLVLTVELGYWLAEVRPRMPAAMLDVYRKGKQLLAAGRIEDGIGHWHQLAETAEDWRLRSWIYLRAGETWTNERAWEKAEAAHRKALAQARDAVSQVVILEAMGFLFIRRHAWDSAQDALRSTLEIHRRLRGESLGIARSKANLGLVAAMKGDFRSAQVLFLEALVIYEKLAPDSIQLAHLLRNLAAITANLGDLGQAEEYHRRALLISEKLDPGGPLLAGILNNLGVAASNRGDLVLSEHYHQRALAITEKLAGEDTDVAGNLNNLGGLALSRGDLALAEHYFRRSLTLCEKLDPESLLVASALNNLGIVAREAGNPVLAEHYHRRALAIEDKQAPNSLVTARSMTNLGDLAYAGGDLARAQEYYQRAAAVVEELAPESLQLAGVVANLGKVAHLQGRLVVAEEYLGRALTTQEKLAPDSRLHAETLHALGRVYRGQRRLQPATDLFARSLAALEGQIRQLGGSQEARGVFRTRYRDLYRDTIELLLEQDRGAEAFHTLERSRARSLLAMLAERDLVFTADVPAELEKARRRLAVRHDRILARMQDLSAPKDAAQLETLLAEMKDLYRERDRVRARIRETSPRLAALQYPQPLTHRQVREILDPGTVVLAYSVGETQTDVFVVTTDAGRPRIETLALGEDQLRRQINDFRDSILKTSSTDSVYFPSMVELGRQLYQSLIDPVAEAVAPSDRVLILPDGPLHLLPFAALVRENAARPRYLAEWKPLHTVVSATLFAELKRSRPQGNGGRVRDRIAAFGNPHYPDQLAHGGGGRIPEPRLRAAADRGWFDWTPLPYSGREVERLTELYPPAAVHKYLGEDATEEQVKALERTTRILHFAVHAYVDDRFPLSSGLVLTIPEGFPEDRDNGLLQAWEIFERVRVDADLVVLSACASGLGEERWGEGLIGLTRAFQYAGARSVAATLWPVPDQVTAELMVRFHRHLRSGKAKDLALRAAQLELIREPIAVENAAGQKLERDVSAPVYWAAFQLYGDWR